MLEKIKKNTKNDSLFYQNHTKQTSNKQQATSNKLQATSYKQLPFTMAFVSTGTYTTGPITITFTQDIPIKDSRDLLNAIISDIKKKPKKGDKPKRAPTEYNIFMKKTLNELKTQDLLTKDTFTKQDNMDRFSKASQMWKALNDNQDIIIDTTIKNDKKDLKEQKKKEKEALKEQKKKEKEALKEQKKKEKKEEEEDSN
jgi:hypothetical protein